MVSWDKLRRLYEDCQLPWLIMGDFNEIMYSFKKKGGRLRAERQRETFREALEDCELSDIDFSRQWKKKFSLPFQSRMIFEEGFEEQVNRIWGSSNEDLLGKLASLGNGLKEWVRINKGIWNRTRKVLSQTLEELNNEDLKEERLAKITEKRIMVKGLKDGSGRWIERDEELLALAANYFNDPFSSKPMKDCEKLWTEIQPSIPEHINEDLSTSFKEEDLWEALKSMAPLKALSTGGFPAMYLIWKSNNVNDAVKLQIGRELGVRLANNPKKYLRLSTMKEETLKGLFLEEQAKEIGSIPLRNALNLKGHRLKYDALCPLCGEEDEFVSHIFQDYILVKQVLQQMTLTLAPVHENQEWKQWLMEAFNLNNAYKCSCLIALFQFIPQEANGAAHAMALWGRESDFPTFWVEETPLEFEEGDGLTKLQRTQKMMGRGNEVKTRIEDLL
ncbi:hypothetical protein Gotri_002599 [Gossypium trilobum]|uniref:Reverse transcriptase n=1 Tax=Gossypium trilobum TaxID=34281 RepID=A0A7J9FAV3_9ROSI|nr:hypothetical protein [Gossypium trilobum]